MEAVEEAFLSPVAAGAAGKGIDSEARVAVAEVVDLNVKLDLAIFTVDDAFGVGFVVAATAVVDLNVKPGLTMLTVVGSFEIRFVAAVPEFTGLASLVFEELATAAVSLFTFTRLGGLFAVGGFGGFDTGDVLKVTQLAVPGLITRTGLLGFLNCCTVMGESGGLRIITSGIRLASEAPISLTFLSSG